MIIANQWVVDQFSLVDLSQQVLFYSQLLNCMWEWFDSLLNCNLNDKENLFWKILYKEWDFMREKKLNNLYFFTYIELCVFLYHLNLMLETADVWLLFSISTNECWFQSYVGLRKFWNLKNSRPVTKEYKLM